MRNLRFPRPPCWTDLLSTTSLMFPTKPHAQLQVLLPILVAPTHHGSLHISLQLQLKIEMNVALEAACRSDRTAQVNPAIRQGVRSTKQNMQVLLEMVHGLEQLAPSEGSTGIARRPAPSPPAPPRKFR